tara:strand:- start:98 stop:1333 length:1236 start_codon:yes stop_codon:yes gene_type:complete
MLELIKKYLYKPIYGISLIIISSILFSLCLGNTFAAIFEKEFNYIIFSFMFISYFILVEIIFVIFYFLKKKSLYIHPPKVNFNKIPYKGHPYIPYQLKENVTGTPPAVYSYPLHKGKYKFHKVETNNLGFLNGLDGNRNVTMPKSKNCIRINCVGASTTMNYLVYKDKVYSYPLELENQLKINSKNNYEVNNCGQGGYNSADIMIRLFLQILDTEPDVIALYHGYADVRSYLSDNFKSDYSHSRYNLSEFYNKLKFNTAIPKMPLSFLNFLIGHWFPYNFGISLVDLIHKEKLNLNSNPEKGLKTFERNIQYIIDVCHARKIKLILSSFCNFLYEDVKNQELHKKYNEIIKKENKILKYLSEKNKTYFVDNANLIPQKEEYFVDTIHFSHKGMQLIASNFADQIKSIYEKQ